MFEHHLTRLKPFAHRCFKHIGLDVALFFANVHKICNTTFPEIGGSSTARTNRPMSITLFLNDATKIVVFVQKQAESCKKI